MQEYSVLIDNVSFGYDTNRKIVNNVSLKIPKGKIVAIMGGSGCGKTTLLRLISGQIKPDCGSIKLFDHELNNISNSNMLQLRKRLGMLFQFGALFTDMTVFENVAFTLQEHTNLNADLIKTIVAMKLQAVGLFGTQDLMPQELSGGMARRVALARSIALDPELMLYDEPFTGLDPISLNVSALLIQKLNKSLNQTVILVTHDINSTFKIADYIYFMSKDGIIAQGTVDEIKNSKNAMINQFVTGNTESLYNFEYPTIINYQKYLGLV
jgi:phospholipid/cholesterol/gamma-HCH transport system ATP-binding protein